MHLLPSVMVRHDAAQLRTVAEKALLPRRFAVVLFGQKSKQHPYLRRQPRRTPIEGVQYGGADTKVLEYRKERAAAQFVDNGVDRKDGDAVAA